MRNEARVVVIGGGVVGCSVLYHLTKLGWQDVVLLERDELTSGSTWHAAGGMHTINSDPNVAKLQDYTIRLYRELEQISGQSCGIHLTGGIMLAGTPERLDFLKTAHARGRLLGADRELLAGMLKTTFRTVSRWSNDHAEDKSPAAVARLVVDVFLRGTGQRRRRSTASTRSTCAAR